MSSVEPVVSFLEEHHISDYFVSRGETLVRFVIAVRSLEEAHRLTSAFSGSHFFVPTVVEWSDAQHAQRANAYDLIAHGSEGHETVQIVFELKHPHSDERGRSDYDRDFAEWARSQARVLRERDWHRLDVANVAEEIEDLSKSEHRELKNRLRVLAMHVLKWNHQPGERSRSWAGTIRQQQAEIETLLEDSPSLRGFLPQYLSIVYSKSRELAAVETGLPESTFPAEAPFSVDELLRIQPTLPEQ